MGYDDIQYTLLTVALIGSLSETPALICSSAFVPFSSQGEASTLDHSFSSVKDDLSLCDDPLSPQRKIIGDRGGPASMKENICQVSFG